VSVARGTFLAWREPVLEMDWSAKKKKKEEWFKMLFLCNLFPILR
jgi:hypothetical protein